MPNLKATCLALLTACITGCALLGTPAVPRFVQLTIDGNDARIPAMGAIDSTLLVTLPQPHPGYAGSRFVYIEADHRIDQYGEHVWADEPGRMIRAALVRAFEQGGGFTAVLSAPSSANADLRLDLELLRLHQDYRTGADSVLVLAMRAQLVALATRRVITTRTIEIVEPAGRGPVAGAAAADRALARMLENLVPEVAEAAAVHRALH